MFITFEGIDGSGKTTQLKLLAETLRNKGFDVLETKEPGGTQLGQIISEILLNPDHTQLASPAEMLLFIADRIQHLHEVITPALEEGKTVLCDRYHHSTLAYQGGGRQIDLNWLHSIENRFIIIPDLTFLLNISVEESKRRTKNKSECRMEDEDKLFFGRVIKAYAQLQSAYPHRIINIQAEDKVGFIHNKVLRCALAKIEKEHMYKKEEQRIKILMK